MNKKGLIGYEISDDGKKFPKDIIFASDTIVYKDYVIGKPKNKIEATKIINKLNNAFHTVMTSFVAAKYFFSLLNIESL